MLIAVRTKKCHRSPGLFARLEVDDIFTPWVTSFIYYNHILAFLFWITVWKHENIIRHCIAKKLYIMNRLAAILFSWHFLFKERTNHFTFPSLCLREAPTKSHPCYLVSLHRSFSLLAAVRGRIPASSPKTARLASGQNSLHLWNAKYNIYAVSSNSWSAILILLGSKSLETI